MMLEIEGIEYHVTKRVPIGGGISDVYGHTGCGEEGCAQHARYLGAHALPEEYVAVLAPGEYLARYAARGVDVREHVEIVESNAAAGTTLTVLACPLTGAHLTVRPTPGGWHVTVTGYAPDRRDARETRDLLDARR